VRCKTCHHTDWELVWFRALIEEGKPLNLYQCINCKRVVIATEDWKESDGEA